MSLAESLNVAKIFINSEIPTLLEKKIFLVDIQRISPFSLVIMHTDRKKILAISILRYQYICNYV